MDLFKRLRENIAFSPAISIMLGIIIVVANLAWFLPTRDSLRQTASEIEIESARSGAALIGGFLEGKVETLELAAKLLHTDLKDPYNRSVLEQVIKQSSFKRVTLADADGNEIILLDTFEIVLGSDLGNISTKKEFKEASFNREPVFGEVMISDKFEPEIEIAFPVSFVEGETNGVLIAELNLKSVFDVVSQVTIGGRGHAYLVDDKGLLISHPDQSLVLKNITYLNRPIVADILRERGAISAKDDRYAYTNEDGIRVLGAASFIPKTGWAIIVEEPRSAALEQLRTVEVLALFIVIFVILSVFFLQRIVAKLESERRHIGSIIANLTDGVIEYDNSFIISTINRATERLLNIRERDVAGKEIVANDLGNPNLKSLVQVIYPALAPYSKTVAQLPGGVTVSEIQVTHPVERDLQIVTAPIVDIVTGRVTRFLKLARDITREKVINRSKSEFISIAAHQMRTPLSGIKWSMKLVLDGDVGVVDPKQRELLQRAYETNERMIRLVADLLDVARIDEGRFGYEFKKSNLPETARLTVYALSAEAEHRNIKLDLTADNVPEFSFDQSRMTLVIQNLVENSIRYTLSGGSVRVTIKDRKTYAMVSVSDTGVGIPRKELPRIFTKFFRAENIIRMQTDGSGLGLFIVRNIVHEHGGEIYIASEQNKGTKIWFTLPYDTMKTAEPDKNGR